MNSLFTNKSSQNIRYTNWNSPFLAQASSIAHSVLVEHTSNSITDWSKQHVLFTPSKRSARKLQEYLCLQSHEKEQILPTYEINTISHFSTSCFNKPQSLISKIDSIILWQRVIDIAKEEDLAFDHFTLDNTAVFFLNLRSKLSDASLKPSHIIDYIQKTHIDLDVDFWKRTSKLWELYEHELEIRELHDTYSIRYENLTEHIKDSIESITFISCLEKPLYILRAIEKLNIPITHIVQAPEEMKDGFDDFGNAKPQFWKSMYPEINTSQLYFPETEIEQVAQIITHINEAKAAGFKEGSITLTLLDQNSIGPLQAALKKNEISYVSPGVDTVSTSPLGSLCEKLSKAICYQKESLLGLFEHPYFLTYAKKACGLESSTDILEALDYLKINQLITTLSYAETTPKEIKETIQRIRTVLSQLEIKQGPETCKTTDYLKKISDIIEKIKMETACEFKETEYALMQEIFNELSSSSDQIPPHLFHTILREALYAKDIITGDLEGVELFGWDETALHDSPVNLVINCSDQNFPQKLGFDPILPEKLKTELGLRTSESYEAAQIISLHSLLKSKACMIFSCPKYNISGDRNTLSKFLILGNKNFTDILQSFYTHTEVKQIRETSIQAIQNILPKTKYDSFPLKNLSASKIKTYIECPFHFYVRHILQAEFIEYESFELEHNQIGTLLHSVFNTLSEILTPEIPEEIIEHVFQTEAVRYFGTNWSTPLAIQLDLLKLKCNAYGEWHATHRKDWKDLYSEHRFTSEELCPSIQDRKIPFSGIIDRISYCPSENILKVIDFKTGDSPYSFSRALKKQGWLDPQLPLYAAYVKRLAEKGGIKYRESEIAPTTPILMSYVHFNKSGEYSEDTKLYSEDMGEEIKDLLTKIISRIFNQEFWPPLKTSEITKRLFGNITFDYPLSSELDGESDD